MDYPIQVAARRSGLTAGTLRAWERRYDGIRPERDAAGRRRYTDDLIEKLALLSALVEGGYRISEIAALDIAELRNLYGQLSVFPAHVSPPGPGTAETAEGSTPERAGTGPGAAAGEAAAAGGARSPHPSDGLRDQHVATAVEAVGRIDDLALYRVLEEATLTFGRLEIVDRFIFPLIHRVDALVEGGELSAVHAGFLRTTIRSVLASLYAPRSEEAERPVVVLAAAASAHQDVGLVASAIHCHAAGWHPVVLGAGIPAEQIVEAARTTGAKAVILSVVSARYDFSAWEELTRTRRAIGEQIPVYFGGRMPSRLVDDLEEAGLHHLADMDQMRSTLAAQPG